MRMTLKKKLQIRFVLLSMAALLLLQGGIVSFSVWHSYQDMVSKSDVILSQLRQNPSANFRYFSVKVHPGKGSVRIDTIQNVSVTPAQAGEYAKAVLHTDTDKGFIDGYRYHLYNSQEGMRILFLSRHSSIEMHRSTAAGLIWISVCALAVMCVVLCFLSGLVVAPLVENHRKQKQFITAAGHQLKTPLTVIRTHGQLLQCEIGENEWLEGILAQTDLLTGMTNDLVTLAKAEEYDNPVKPELFSLANAVAEIADIYTAPAKRKNIRLECGIPEQLDYRGNEQELRQLLSILLDNACKYCPKGGQISLELSKELRGINLRISNTTQALNAAPSAVTQRFFRGENAAGKEGFGLGLSIAQAIVHRHKGKLRIEAMDDRFCVSVVLH